MRPPRQRKKATVTCCHCGLTLNRRNFRLNLNRRHTPVREDITAANHLRAQCLDQNNGVYAVGKSFSAPCLPIHVKKKTWGQEQGSSCEVNICRIHLECAHRSNLRTFIATTCSPLHSTAPPADTGITSLVPASLEVLVGQKWFGEGKRLKCLESQTEAAAAGIPLSCMVTVCGPTNTRYICV